MIDMLMMSGVIKNKDNIKQIQQDACKLRCWIGCTFLLGQMKGSFPNA